MPTKYPSRNVEPLGCKYRNESQIRSRLWRYGSGSHPKDIKALGQDHGESLSSEEDRTKGRASENHQLGKKKQEPIKQRGSCHRGEVKMKSMGPLKWEDKRISSRKC